VKYEITIDSQSGTFGIGNVTLEPQQIKSEVEKILSQLLKSQRDHSNGYEWLYLEGLTFGGEPTSAGLCFQDGKLEHVSWSVMLPDAPMEGDWPTREAIDAEVAFVRGVLARKGITVGERPQKYLWGEIWSTFDSKGFVAANGLRFK